MKIRSTALQGVKLIEPDVYGDPRGFFLEYFNQPRFRDEGCAGVLAEVGGDDRLVKIIEGLRKKVDEVLPSLMIPPAALAGQAHVTQKIIAEAEARKEEEHRPGGGDAAAPGDQPEDNQNDRQHQAGHPEQPQVMTTDERFRFLRMIGWVEPRCVEMDDERL